MYNSNNTATHFECEIEKLSYYYVEREIARYFDMGIPSSSDIPPEVPEGLGDIYTLVGTRKLGKFSISIYALKNGKYQLSVSLQGKLSNV